MVGWDVTAIDHAAAGTEASAGLADTANAALQASRQTAPATHRASGETMRLFVNVLPIPEAVVGWWVTEFSLGCAALRLLLEAAEVIGLPPIPGLLAAFGDYRFA